MSWVLGLVLWAFQAYVFGFLNLRFLTYVYIIGSVALFLFRKLEYVMLPKRLIDEVTNHKLLCAFVIIGIILQLIPVFASGVLYSDGVRFFGINGKDGIMHLAYIQRMVHHFPPQEPGASGTLLINYHYWSDMMIVELVRIWRIPTQVLFFQFFPIFISTLTALAGYQLMRILGFSKTSGWWIIFFLFLTGDLAYALTLLTRHTFSFSAPVIDNGVDQFLNMPNAVARPVFLTGMATFTLMLKEKSRYWSILTVLLFSSLVGIKVYYGIFVILGLGSVCLYFLIMDFLESKSFSFSKLLKSLFLRRVLYLTLLCTIIVGFLIYFPANKYSGGLIWQPFEWVKIFLGPEALNWGYWFSLHQSSQSNVLIRTIADVIAIVITLFCIHGTRLLGIFAFKNLSKKSIEICIFFLPAILLFHIIGLFTLQEAGDANVFNFFVVGSVVLSILSAIVLEKVTLSQTKVLATGFAVLLIALSIARPVNEIGKAITQVKQPKDNSVLVSRDELAGLSYIRSHSTENMVVQAHPTDPLDHETPYISFFSDRPTYLSGIALQQTHNLFFPEREKKIKELFDETGSPGFNERARGIGIHFIYLKKIPDQELHFTPENQLVEKTYENNSIIVYKIVYPRNK